MGDVAVHPRVALLRGYPKRPKSKQLVDVHKSVKERGNIEIQVPFERLSVPDAVVQWAKMPRTYESDITEKKILSPPPFRRHIDDLESADITFATRFDTENSIADSQNSAKSKGKTVRVPSRPAPAPVLSSFLSGLIGSWTSHASTFSEYPRGHKYANRSETSERSVYRPPSRLGYRKVSSDAFDCLSKIAEKSDQAKLLKRGRSRYPKYRREPLLLCDEGDEQDLSDIALCYSDDDEEEMRMIFARSINAMESI